MSKPPFNPDARNLEDAFFARENARLLDEMRKRDAHQERRDALRQVMKGADDPLLDHLIALGVNPETVLAMMLLPLVRVAWADGAINEKERGAILKAAELRGLESGSPGYEVLKTWLAQKPGEAIIATWGKYIAGTWPSLTSAERSELRKRLLDLARGVAEAAGGFLGLGSKVSAAEQAVLEEIDAALR